MIRIKLISMIKSGPRVRTLVNFLSKESASWFIKAAKFHICYDRHHHYLHHNHHHHQHHHQHNLINIASSLTSGMRKLVSSCIRLAGCFRLLRDRGLCCSSRPPPTPCLPARGGKKCKKKTKKTRHRHKAPLVIRPGQSHPIQVCLPRSTANFWSKEKRPGKQDRLFKESYVSMRQRLVAGQTSSNCLFDLISNKGINIHLK